MRHLLVTTFAAGALAVSSATAQAPVPSRPGPTPHVLLVVSSAGRDSGRTSPGFEQDELSQAWLLLTGNGYRVTIASPAGGAPQADRYDPAAEYNAAFLADPRALAQLRATRRTADVRAHDYDAVMLIGGKGAMFDLPRDTALARLVGAVHDRGGVVAAVCHGPAGLLRARTRDGRLLVAGRAMTGFTDEEEVVFGKEWLPRLPFKLEEEARRSGARWDESPMMMPKVVVDDRVVTGQNPYSTAAATEALIRALGGTPRERTRWRDEAAVHAAVELLALEPALARRRLAESRERLQIDLIGLLGYYQLQAAQATPDVARAVTLMELAGPYMAAPQITLGLAQGYARLGRTEEARVLAADVAERHARFAAQARTVLGALPR